MTLHLLPHQQYPKLGFLPSYHSILKMIYSMAGIFHKYHDYYTYRRAYRVSLYLQPFKAGTGCLVNFFLFELKIPWVGLHSVVSEREH